LLPPSLLPAAKGPATATPQDTLTPTSTNTIFTAHFNYDTPCLAGPGEDHEMVTTVAQGKDMMLIAKDKEPPAWLLIRPAGVKDCWVDGKFVTSYDIPAVAIFPTPVPLTATAVPTRTLPPTKTVTPSATDTPKAPVTAGLTRTHRPGDTPLPAVPTKTSNPSSDPTPGSGIPSQTPGNPSNPPTNTSRPPTNTPRPPTNTPHPPPTRTPVPSPTVDYPHKECNDGMDNDGDGYRDSADPQCQNNGDDSEAN
jgi:hypothetical protein